MVDFLVKWVLVEVFDVDVYIDVYISFLKYYK